MSLFKKLFSDDEFTEEVVVEEKTKQAKFLFPIVDDTFPNSVAKWKQDGKDPNLQSSRRPVARPLPEVALDQETRRSRRLQKEASVEDQLPFFSTKFKPIEVPPPMHMLFNREAQVVFELPDFSNKWVDESNDRVDGTDDRIAGTDDRIAGTNDRIAGSNDRIDRTNDHLAGTNDHLAGTNDHLAGENERLIEDELSFSQEPLMGKSEFLQNISALVESLKDNKVLGRDYLDQSGQANLFPMDKAHDSESIQTAVNEMSSSAWTNTQALTGSESDMLASNQNPDRDIQSLTKESLTATFLNQSSEPSRFQSRIEEMKDQVTFEESRNRQVHAKTLESKSVSHGRYQLPKIELLQPSSEKFEDTDWVEHQVELLDDTLFQFNVNAKVVHYEQGPSVTRFEIQPEPGVKVSKITNLGDDLKLSLAARDIRIEAPIPGKRTIGIEIPNRSSRPVFIREILEDQAFRQHPSPLAIAVGLDISGRPITTDMIKMPHGLVAGSTGSGKSVFINSMLVSLLYKSAPEDVKLLLIDPKMVELNAYNGIPHLVTPVVTDPKTATAALKWAVDEMERRYELFAKAGVRDIVRFNEKAIMSAQTEVKLPYIVIVIDELADLMMTAPVDVEDSICRIAQKARAAGMHLIVATQRPSVDVITGLIKANIPTRIAFSVSAQIDSRTILDQGGAEKLLGRGDMLFLENGTSKTMRLQGTFVTDAEIEKVVQHIKSQASPNYLFEKEELIKMSQQSQVADDDQDELFLEACEFSIETNSASTSSLQRRFRIGYNRAARIIELMEQYGVISETNGTKPRNVLITKTELETLRTLFDMSKF